MTVVGVARDIKVNTLDELAQPYYYVPLSQSLNADTGIAIQLRTRATDPLALLPDLRATVRQIDPKVLLFEAFSLEDFVSGARFVQKATASLLGILSTIALALTSLGLYGVLAFAVAQRTPEIGVRLALGAQPSDIARLVLSRGALLIGVGVAVGLLGAFAAARAMAHALAGLSTFEPLALVAASALVVVPALLACWLPARRATKVDPMTALRAE